MALIEKHQIDLTDISKFPNFTKKWQSFLVKLVEERCSETDHHIVVDSVSVECIYELLFTVMSALKACGMLSFDEMIKKVPAKLHKKMHHIMQ